MNKFYIQIALFILSIFAYANNVTLATELAPEENATPKSNHYFPTPEEVYEKNKHLLCTDPEEIKNAEELMNEAVKHLEYHATSKEGYKLFLETPDGGISHYKKKHEGNTKVLKVNLNIYASNQYDEIINKFWDPDTPNTFNTGSVKIVRVYNPNLVIIEQRCPQKCTLHHKYFYALAKRTQISENKTIIVMTSADIDDHNPFRRKYKNKIIKSADLFKTSIDSEYYIRQEGSKNLYVNIAGYLVEKKGDNLEVTYVESIDGKRRT
ncbi:fam-a protein [Plasmodium vinckei lentum]|uniref:Fam-a protein n=1 Tax=Plasmodium vinckei lentum TaxID=138297 RepID=A0A6V7SLX8_PLAVN|nr:fam-a protein [Plasmodium vinckei lentum]